MKARLRRMAARQIAHASGGRLPDLPAALALKSWAKFLPGASRERHLQDAVTLLVCIDRQEVACRIHEIGRSPPACQIATDEVAWQTCVQDDWAKAVRAARGIDPEWPIPTFIRPPRPTRRQP